MSGSYRKFCAVLSLIAALFVGAGCQKAKPYPVNSISSPRAKADDKTKTGERSEKPIPDGFGWMDPGRESLLKDDLRIEFVHEGTSPEEWGKLGNYWNDPSLARAVGTLGLPGLGGAALAAEASRRAIKIKVPLGLEDPSAYIPATNPPTKARWELGRKLFFDGSWLTAKGNQSCASCHDPKKGYTDGSKSIEGGYNVPTLVNVVFNTHQFWDGRATFLEEVVQRTLEDEREPRQSGSFSHVWPGVIGRLRESKSWMDDFNRVYGTAPTQENVGKSIATYVRTLLAGDSLLDRAVAAQHKKGARKLLAEHVESVLNEDALTQLRRSKDARAKIAAELARGHDLFAGKAGCSACHPAGNGHYSDGRFHNIGVESERIDAEKDARLGRFAWAPYGEKNRYLKGAYKTPSLRGLSRTGPYFHDGSAADLVSAVRFHVKPETGKPFNFYLDPKLAGNGGEHRSLGLSEQDIADLVLYLRALDGGEVDAFVRAAPR